MMKGRHWFMRKLVIHLGSGQNSNALNGSSSPTHVGINQRKHQFRGNQEAVLPHNQEAILDQKAGSHRIEDSSETWLFNFGILALHWRWHWAVAS
jgi:hypothetical protein